MIENVYANNVIHNIFSGKAFSRAVMRHMLTHTQLLQIMVENLLERRDICLGDIEKLSNFKPEDPVLDNTEEGCNV